MLLESFSAMVLLVASVSAMSSPMCHETFSGKRLCGQSHTLLRDWGNKECQCGNRHGIELSCIFDSSVGKQICDETPVSQSAPECSELSDKALALCGRSHPIPAGHRECRCPSDHVCIPELSTSDWSCNTVSECHRMNMDPCNE